MHQTMRKVLAILLVLCLIVGVLPLSANAALIDDASRYVTQQLSLGEDLVLHLRASLPEKYEELAKDAVGTLTYSGQTKTYTMDDMTPDENGMYDMAIEMAVAEMTEDIHAVINAKVLGVNQEIINEHYSIRDYLVTIIEGDYSQTTKDLCLELLNMGTWAQLYFNHNTGALANAGYSTSASNAVPEEIPEVLAQGALDGVQFKGATVRFLSQTAVRFYFEVDGAADGYTFSIDGKTYEPILKDGMYYIETPGINPQNMSKTVTASVSDGANTVSVEYAPIWYFVRTYNKTQDDYLKALMEAAYSYYKAAENYKTQICMDVEFTTLGNSTEDVELGFYPLGFEGSIHEECPERVSIKAGTTTTIKVDQGNLLVNGEFLGIGIVVFGGPEWNDAAGDKHAFTITNMRLEGPEDRPIDLRCATVTTGFGGSNSGGTAAISNSTLTVTNGIRYDGHVITFNEVDTYLALDMEITTLSNSTDPIDVAFYPHGFEGDYVKEYTDKLTLTAGTTNSVYLDASKYLVDGEIPGIGFVIFGGPEWNDPAGDRHAVNVSNVRLEGKVDQTFDLTNAAVATAFAGSNGGGVAAVVDGVVTVTGGYRYDGHMITFVPETVPEETEPEVTEPEVTEPEVTEPEVTEPEVTEPEVTEPPVEEPDTYISLDVLINTLGNSTDPIEVRFYPYNYEGSVHSGYTDLVTVTAATTTTVKLDASKYLVDGELTGIGFGIFGGPEWNDAAGDRHTVTISNVKLEGEQSAIYDLNQSVVTSGQNGTGYTDANGWGSATIGDSIVITGGIRYDAHKISLAEAPDTYIVLDMLLTTLGNSNDKVEIGFFPYNFTGDINANTDKIAISAGAQTTVKLDLSKYLVDGAFNGIGFVIFGGPEWNTQLGDGTYDRHSLTISSVKLEGKEAKEFDLSQSVWAKGGNAGYTNANDSGEATIGSSIVITNGFRYDGHKISLVEDTNTYIVMDLKLDTLGGNWTDAVGIRFYPYNFQGNPHETYTDLVMFQTGEQQTVTLDAEKYLVDGKLTGIGIGIFGGPEWNDAAGDRHTVTISNVKLEGEQSAIYDLNQSVVTSGTNGTGYTDGNGWGSATIGDSIVITGGIRYDCHKISLAKAPDTYIVLDMLLTTLGNSSDKVDIGFFPYNFTGDINDNTDKIAISAGTQTTVKLDLSKYLVDGAFNGIGFAIFGGPEWNTQLGDGTYDRHSLTISSVKLEGKGAKEFDLRQSVWAKASDAGYTNANGSGEATIGSSIVITNGFRYDGHKISLVEDTNTYICMDMLLTTLGNSADPVEVRFYATNYTGSVHDAYTDKVTVTAGTSTAIKLNMDKYLVDGEFTGIGVGIFGGPEWNTVLGDGSPDKHEFTISNIRLENVGARAIDMRNATVTTGMTGSNSGGTAAVVDGTVSVTNGIRYDAHMITFNEVDTYLKLDMLITTLGNSTGTIDIGFYPSNFEGDINNHLDRVTVTAGTTTTIYLDSSKYMVDGKLTGIGFAVFGGPAWDTQLEDGTYDRHSIVISNVCLEGQINQTIDLSNATFAKGNDGTGYTNANGSGVATIVDGTIVITNGFCYDGHKISF